MVNRGFAMLLTDAVDAFETVGGIWLGMSAIAFIFLAIFVEFREKPAAIDVTARRDERVFGLVAKTEKPRVSNKAPARKAA
jgi:hypothetical protein